SFGIFADSSLRRWRATSICWIASRRWASTLSSWSTSTSKRFFFTAAFTSAAWLRMYSMSSMGLPERRRLYGPTTGRQANARAAGGRRRELVLRVMVTNNSDEPWQVDVRRQVVTFETGETRGPDMVYASQQGGAPYLAVPARQRVSIDLLYSVPEPAKRLPHFE